MINVIERTIMFVYPLIYENNERYRLMSASANMINDTERTIMFVYPLIYESNERDRLMSA
jgi:hypothetical protein